MMDKGTIVAQCTPRGPGAVALIRISGPDAVVIAVQCARIASGVSLENANSHTIHYGWIVDAQQATIDQVLFLLMRGPRTFTGHDTVEITCHNNQFVIQMIIDRLITCGARLAAGGEFTRQAVSNNKFDLLQAEAINELVHAQSIAATQASMAQLEGSLSSRAAIVEKQLLYALALCEASFEFIDEEIEFAGQINELCNSILAHIDAIVSTEQQSVQIKQGIHIAIIGTVNAGKSSLFNALVGADRAIVTDIAGTTRDVVQACVCYDTLFVTFADTAGIRKTANQIEQQGIARSIEQAEQADLVLLIYDSSRNLSEQEQIVYTQIKEQSRGTLLTIGSKADLDPAYAKNSSYNLCISTKTGIGMEALKQMIHTRIRALSNSSSCPFLINQRHVYTLTTVRAQLQQVQSMLQNSSVEYELVAHEINQIVATFADLTGKEVSAKTMDAIFKSFCVGK